MGWKSRDVKSLNQKSKPFPRRATSMVQSQSQGHALLTLWQLGSHYSVTQIITFEPHQPVFWSLLWASTVANPSRQAAKWLYSMMGNRANPLFFWAGKGQHGSANDVCKWQLPSAVGLASAARLRREQTLKTKTFCWQSGFLVDQMPSQKHQKQYAQQRTWSRGNDVKKKSFEVKNEGKTAGRGNRFSSECQHTRKPARLAAEHEKKTGFACTALHPTQPNYGVTFQ